MKPTNPHLIPFISLAAWTCLTLSAVGTVFQSSVAVWPAFLPSGGTGYEIYATTQPGFEGGGAGLWMTVDTRLMLRPALYTAGIGHTWYRVLDGTVIDPAFAGSAIPFAHSPTSSLSGPIQMTSGGSFLLGFWLDANGDRIADLGDRFGWARLTYATGSGLTLLDNAIEDSGAGIIAGTTTVAPEPSSSLLLALSLGLSLACRKTR